MRSLDRSPLNWITIAWGFPSASVTSTRHVPRTSSLGSAISSNRCPCTQTACNFVFFSNNGPSVTITFANLPRATVPNRSDTPKMSAGAVVSARKAASGARPRSMAVRTAARKSFWSAKPWLVKAILIPALSSRPGFSGAMSQCINRSSLAFKTASAVATLGGLGKSNGKITARPVCLIASMRLYSCPEPSMAARKPNSRATRSARK